MTRSGELEHPTSRISSMDAGSTGWYREAAEAVLRPLGDAESHFDSA